MASRRRKKGRPVDGVLVLDKPKGVTSNEALQQVKWFYNAAKAGHTGSLDPLATGLLPICLGEATKFSQYLLDSDKTYRVEAKLGIRTESGDTEGGIVSERPVPELTEKQLLDVLAKFKGVTEQIPSMYSALKHNGEPLYKLARQGIEVERKPRKIEVFRLELLQREGPILTMEVACSKGTYIRNLVEDIGEVIGCGAHVVELRRIEAGPYVESQMITMDQLKESSERAFELRNKVKEANPAAFADSKNQVNCLSLEVRDQLNESWDELDQYLLATATAVGDWPEIKLNEQAAYYFQQGQCVRAQNAPLEGLVKITGIDEDDTCYFIGVGEINEDGLVAPKRLVSQAAN